MKWQSCLTALPASDQFCRCVRDDEHFSLTVFLFACRSQFLWCARRPCKRNGSSQMLATTNTHTAWQWPSKPNVVVMPYSPISPSPSLPLKHKPSLTATVSSVNKGEGLGVFTGSGNSTSCSMKFSALGSCWLCWQRKICTVFIPVTQTSLYKKSTGNLAFLPVLTLDGKQPSLAVRNCLSFLTAAGSMMLSEDMALVGISKHTLSK